MHSIYLLIGCIFHCCFRPFLVKLIGAKHRLPNVSLSKSSIDNRFFSNVRELIFSQHYAHFEGATIFSHDVTRVIAHVSSQSEKELVRDISEVILEATVSVGERDKRWEAGEVRER